MKECPRLCPALRADGRRGSRVTEWKAARALGTGHCLSPPASVRAHSRYLYEVHFAVAGVVSQVLDDNFTIVLDPALSA